MFSDLFYCDLPIYGIWQDNGIPANGNARPLGESTVTVILTNFFQGYTLEIADSNVLAFMQESRFNDIVWATEDARINCAIRNAILGK